MANPDRMWNALSMSDSDYLRILAFMFQSECYFRLSKLVSAPTPNKQVVEKKSKKPASVEVFEFRKGKNQYHDVLNVLALLARDGVSRKPTTKEDAEKYELREWEMGDCSDYEIFEKDAKVTVEIFD